MIYLLFLIFFLSKTERIPDEKPKVLAKARKNMIQEKKIDSFKR